MARHALSTSTPLGDRAAEATARRTVGADAVVRVLGGRDGHCRVTLVGRPAAHADLALTVVEAGGPDALLDLHWRPATDPAAFSTFDGRIDLTPAGTTPDTTVDLRITGTFALSPGGAGGSGQVDAQRIVGSTRMLARRLARGLARQVRARGSDGGHGHGRTLQVRDVMTHGAVSLRADTDLQTAAMVLLDHRISCAPVVDDGRLVGLLSVTDLFGLGARAATASAPRADDHAAARRPADARGPTADVVGDVMSRPALTTTATTGLRDAVDVMTDRDIGRLVVVDGDAVAGVVSRHDLLKGLARTAEVVGHAVDDALAEAGVTEVLARVRPDRSVVLRGRTGPRRARAAVAAVRDVEGVTGVDDRIAVAGGGGG